MLERILTAFAAALVAVFFATPASAQSAPDIVAKTDTIMAPDVFTARTTMDVERDDGSTRTYEMTLARRGDDSLVRFEAPRVEKGRKLLRRGDDMWMMLPDVKRPVRVSARQDLMGGDFNNADVLRLSLVDDYTATLLEKKGEVAIIDLRAKDRSVTYARIVAEIDAPSGLPIRYTYFTESGKKVKTMEFQDVQENSDGVSRPTRWVMTNLVTNRSSTMKVADMVGGKAPEADAFTLGRLSR